MSQATLFSGGSQSRTTARAAAFHVRGVVQGVGFRPFVYRLARELGLAGCVRNDGRGVAIHAEGPPAALAEFARRLTSSAPEAAAVAGVVRDPADPTGASEFRILGSHTDAGAAALVRVPPDRAVCPACRWEIADRQNRRFGHA